MKKRNGLENPRHLRWKLKPYRWAFLHPAESIPRGSERLDPIQDPDEWLRKVLNERAF